MSSQTVKLIDRDKKVVATAQVSELVGQFTGMADLSLMPVDLRRKLEEYEEIVEGQIFSLLDEVEESISCFEIKAVLDGTEVPIEDLQIYPSTNRVSFKVCKRALDQVSPRKAEALLAAAKK
jgi:hypothetical protein